MKSDDALGTWRMRVLVVFSKGATPNDLRLCFIYRERRRSIVDKEEVAHLSLPVGWVRMVPRSSRDDVLVL